jgi:iron(III) transport system substrate-binding protein
MKLKKVLSIVLATTLILTLVGCSSKKKEEDKKADTETTEEAKGDPETKDLVVYCPHPLEFIDPIVAEYEAKTGVEVEVIAAGGGELLKRIESESSNPLGDVMWGGSLNTLGPYTDYFEDYSSTNEPDISDHLKNDDGKISRFSDIPSILMVNTNLVGDIEINGYEDLLNPALKGKIAFADPSKSSSSLEHLVNILYAMGDGDPEKGWDYMEKLIANLDGKLLSGSSAVYKGVADGEYTVGLTFEEGGAKYVKNGAPIKLVYMEEGVIAKPDGVCIIKGAKNMANAKSFVEFVTGKEAQTLMATELSRRSVRKDVEPAEGLAPMDEITLIQDDEGYVLEHKQEWLDKFRDIYTS